jgi:hypothetical protein
VGHWFDNCFTHGCRHNYNYTDLSWSRMPFMLLIASLTKFKLSFLLVLVLLGSTTKSLLTTRFSLLLLNYIISNTFLTKSVCWRIGDWI